MGIFNCHLIRALLLAAAILSLLLTTPSLKAATVTHSKTKTTNKIHRTKTKIIFDGSSDTTPQAELGDEIVQPRSDFHALNEPQQVVQMRGNSIDDLWAKNHKSSAHVKSDLDDQADLIQPVSISDVEEPASRRAQMKNDLSVNNPNLNEASLASFKKSNKKSKKVFVSSSARKERTKVADKAAAVTIKRLEPRTAMASQALIYPPSHAQPKTVFRYASASKTRSHLSTKSAAEEPSEFKYGFAFETTVTMGRKYELETPGDRNFGMKNEVFLGTSHSSGWGAKLSAAYVTTSNDDAQKDVHEMGDPSIIVSHPSLYKDRDIDVYGRFRYYAPVAATSRAVGLQHFAYYLLTDLQLPAQMAASNTLTTRYFQQTSYADADAFSLVFDSTEITKKLDWVRLGLGQQTQVESHQVTAPGTTAEIYPFLDFLGIPSALIEAKLYLPVYASGLVAGAPSAVSISNIQAEFFMKLSF